jgi:hypothetical protein
MFVIDGFLLLGGIVASCFIIIGLVHKWAS